jgi:hypothetical protein
MREQRPMKSVVFNLEGRRNYVDLYELSTGSHSLFMWGSCSNAHCAIDGRQVWVHGTFGDAAHSGIGGRYYEVAIDRRKALRTQFPSIEVVGEPKQYPSAQSLANAQDWACEGDGRIKLSTYCNLNVSFCRSMAYGRPSLQFARWSEAVEREWLANEICREIVLATRQRLQNAGCETQNWIRLDHRTAQHIANLGGFVVAGNYNTKGPGHLVFLTEDEEFILKDYNPSTAQGLHACLHLKCFHCGTGRPRLTELIEVFPTLQIDEGRTPQNASLLDSVILYCDGETWSEYSRRVLGETPS